MSEIEEFIVVNGIGAVSAELYKSVFDEVCNDVELVKNNSSIELAIKFINCQALLLKRDFYQSVDYDRVINEKHAAKSELYERFGDHYYHIILKAMIGCFNDIKAKEAFDLLINKYSSEFI